MRVFDLHCDTLYEIYKRNSALFENDLNVSLKETNAYDAYVGCFAVWIPDGHTPDAAFAFFEKIFSKFSEQKSLNSKHISQITDSFELFNISESEALNKGMILTLENGLLIGNKIERLDYLHKCGVKMITLTWNASNSIGDGSQVTNAQGITKFGIDVIKKMEQLGMVVDVSHASEKLFYDVAKIAKRPIIASHSNSFSVCQHKRNLTDEQFKVIKSFGGIVGINFYKKFLNNAGQSSLYDIIKHIEHFLSLSGEKVLAIGSDFDGCEVTDELKDISYMPVLYEYLLKHNYNENLVKDIFFNNAYQFFEKYFKESEKKGV